MFRSPGGMMFLLQMKLGVDPWRCGCARAHGCCWNPTISLGGYGMDINSFVGLTVFRVCSVSPGRHHCPMIFQITSLSLPYQPCMVYLPAFH